MLVVILINRQTGKVFSFKILYAAAEKVGINPESISHRIKTKRDLCVGENVFLVIKE